MIMICITCYISVCFYIDSRIGASSPLSERQVPLQVGDVALPSEPWNSSHVRVVERKHYITSPPQVKIIGSSPLHSCPKTAVFTASLQGLTTTAKVVLFWKLNGKLNSNSYI